LFTETVPFAIHGAGDTGTFECAVRTAVAESNAGSDVRVVLLLKRATYVFPPADDTRLTERLCPGGHH
jgi:hypothetical protein